MLLFFSFSGIEVFFENCRKFEKAGIRVFVLSGDNYTTMRRLRESFEAKAGPGSSFADLGKNITFLYDFNQSEIGLKLEVVAPLTCLPDPSHYQEVVVTFWDI